ncbi:putative cactin, central domain-containing protein [Plasmopara halstedii]
MPRSDDKSSSRQRRHDKKRHKKCQRLDSESENEIEARNERKARKKSAKMLASLGYSDETNPFGDSSLSQPFVWGKKYEDKGKGKPSIKELKKQQLQRVDEIRKARKRREDRETEREEMERLKSEEMRLKDAEQYEDWQQKEEQFHLKQAKVRSQLRIRANREKPVDLLAKNLLLVSAKHGKNGEDEFFKKEIGRIQVEHRRPHAIVEILSMNELTELQHDICTYEELEESGNGGKNAEFWQLMKIVCDDRIQRLKKSQNEGRADREAIHDSVNESIKEMLKGKDKEGLEKLNSDVKETIASVSNGATGVDVDFWQDVAQQIQVYQARARLTELHEEMLNKLADLMEEHEKNAVDTLARAPDDKLHGVVDENGRDAGRVAYEMEQSFASKELDESEEKFGESEEVTTADSRTVPRWSEKYQPRKPRYFNRVKTGFDWNKYNQTHYDRDNPPPKVVQGYKFNLFYPDLIDKQTAPRFFLEKTHSDEFCIIRFSAGPPYQDIAFKIVNREWEYSHKRGFKSVFERGILQLYFNFKRHRYRR